MKRRFITLIGATCAAFAMTAAGSALAQSKHVLKVGWVTPDSPQDPYATGARAFKQAVERQSNGRIEV